MRSSPINKHAGRLRAGTVAALMPLALGTGAHAQTIGTFYADASLNLGYSSDPYLFGEDEETSSGYAEIVLSPRYVIAEPLGQTTLAADIRRTEYFQNVEASESFSLQAATSRSLSPTTSFSAQGNFNSSIQGERSSLFLPDVDPSLPVPAPTPDPLDPIVDPGLGLGPDVGVSGRRVRRNFYSANASLNTQLSELNSLGGSVGLSHSQFGRSLGINFWSYSGSLSYSRTLSERSRIGISTSLQKTNYTGTAPDATSFSPQLTYNTRLSPELTINASAGIVVINSEDPSGLRDSTGFAGSLNGCYTLTPQSLCFSLSRDASASGFGETLLTTSASMNYSYQITADDRLGVTVYYSRLDTDQVTEDGLSPFGNDYFTTTASYDRQISDRLSVGVSGSYRSLKDGLDRTSEDVTAQLFVRFNVGRVR